MDEAARSRASQHNVVLRTRTEWRYPQDRPSYEVLVQCHADGAPDDLTAFAADIGKLLAPAPIREIEGWLAELSVIVARRSQDEVDEAVRLTAYASRLSLYPADVVRHVLLVLRWKFWPTWDELAAVCDGLTSGRKAMIAAAKTPLIAPPPAPERDPEERDRVRAIGDGYLREKAAEDLRNRVATKRIPHWSETAASDDPRWIALRNARAAANASLPGA